MKKVGFSISVVLMMLLAGCLEPFEPDIENALENYLVIDGAITNEAGPYYVSITTTFGLDGDGSEVTGVSGLNVTIEEENGPIERLGESKTGVYQTVSIQGVVGRRYRLAFDYNGSTYRSNWETILPSAPINNLYYNVETRQTSDINSDVTGVQFFVDSKGSDQDATYYRYEWDETWEIGVFYPSYFDYVGNDELVLTTNPRHTCWKYNSQSVINIATSEGLSENVISEHELGFITGEEEKFTEKYSLLVKQYALSENEYLFWKSLKESNEQLGSLYDKQPANINGNIHNVNSSTEIVLGFFSASGIQKKRIFIDDLDDLSTKVGCAIPLDTLLKDDLEETYDSIIFVQLNRGKIFFDEISTPTSLEPLGVYLSDPKCSDCQLKGGDLNKPDYWDE